MRKLKRRPLLSWTAFAAGTILLACLCAFVQLLVGRLGGSGLLTFVAWWALAALFVWRFIPSE